MIKVFIYYSYTGNGNIVADKIKEKNIDLRPITPKKPLPKSFLGGMLTGGFLAGIKAKTPLLDFDSDISAYDEIIIGSPIWNARVASPINTVLDTLKGTDKKISFIFYAGSGTGKKAAKRINKEFPDAKVLFLQEPKKYPDELNKIEAFIQD